MSCSCEEGGHVPSCQFGRPLATDTAVAKDCEGRALPPYPIETTVVACVECLSVFRTEAGKSTRLCDVQEYDRNPANVKEPIGGWVVHCRAHKEGR